jgi:NADH:ubiquinone oxidoreductase subunit K
MMPIEYYLVLGILLFFIGAFGVVTRRSAIGILLSLELMFNAININLAAWSCFLDRIAGQILVIFVITVAAVETVTGIAIILCIYRTFKETLVDRITILKG